MRKITLATLGLVSAFGFSQNINSKIQTYLNQNAPKYNLSTQDVSDWFVESDGISAPNEISNYYIKQRYQGIEIYNAVTNVWVKNDEVINMANRFQANIASKINTTTPSLSVTQGLQKAFDRVNNQVTANLIDHKGNFEYTFSNGDLENDPIKAELMYVSKNNQLKLVWNYTFYTKDYNHLWDISIDAVSGEVVLLNDMVIKCNFDSKAHSKEAHENHFTKDFYKTSALPANVQGGSYRVIPYNYFSPDETARELISNPENAIASPNGWHNTNNIGGTTASNIFTYLRGNNVWAKADYTGANGISASTNSTANGYSPTSASYVYDYPYPGKGVAANTYINAATTNLFYMNNICHDVWYQYGFNEAFGNFQKNNYSFGASGNDFVYADAQDGSTASTPSYNNANFSTPIDGTNPRMNMYLWKVNQKILTLNSPSEIAGQYFASDNSFNPGHVNLPVAPAMIQTDFVLYDDGTPDVGQTDNADACSAAVNATAINGKIVVIRRSTSVADGGNPCTFIEKVKNAQNAGATAVIIVNNVDVLDANGDPTDTPVGMSGADATITIPAIAISKVTGDPIIAKLLAGETVNAKIQLPEAYINGDGDLDNGVISHEFAHGISTRLTGGRNNSSCLGNPQQMGEGWSDWASMILQIKAGDVGTTPKGMANFVMNLPPTGDGLRNFQYSTDMSVNPLTYGALKGTLTYGPNAGTAYPVVITSDTLGEIIETHNTGEVWASMLWDLTWAYINKYGFDSNIYTGTGGNNKVMQIVLDAMKLQTCGPSYIDARDAIIEADQIKTGGQDYCMIWEVFARRGLGQNAQAGDNSGNITNIYSFDTAEEDFTVPPAGPNCTFGVNYFDHEELFRVFPNPTNGMLNVRINGYNGKTNIEVVDINGRLVNTLRNVDFDTEKTIDLSHLQTGVYVVKVTGNNVNYTAKFIKE